MTGSVVFAHPHGGTPCLAFEGCRHATSGPVRIALMGRLYTWERSRADIDTDLAALATRIETFGLEAALEAVDGEWGLVVEDDRSGTFSFITDHVGTHPLFIAETSSGISVASHLPGLVQKARPGLDENRFAVYLSRGKKDLLQPLFTDARRLGARRCLTVDATGVATEHIWTECDLTPENPPDFEELREIILGTIARECASLANPIGGTLSAGLDGTVLTIALKDAPGFRAYSIDAGAAVDNEMAEINETVRLTGIRHDYVPATFGVDELHALVDACGEPIRELKSISTMHSCVARAGNDGMRSFLLGLGPDMIFAGARMLVYRIFTDWSAVEILSNWRARYPAWAHTKEPGPLASFRATCAPRLWRRGMGARFSFPDCPTARLT